MYCREGQARAREDQETASEEKVVLDRGRNIEKEGERVGSSVGRKR